MKKSIFPWNLDNIQFSLKITSSVSMNLTIGKNSKHEKQISKLIYIQMYTIQLSIQRIFLQRGHHSVVLF